MPHLENLTIDHTSRGGDYAGRRIAHSIITGDVDGLDLTGSRLRECTVLNATGTIRVDGARFVDCTFIGGQLASTEGGEPAQYERCVFTQHTVIPARGADLSRCAFIDGGFGEVDMRGANLRDCTLTGTDTDIFRLCDTTGAIMPEDRPVELRDIVNRYAARFGINRDAAWHTAHDYLGQLRQQDGVDYEEYQLPEKTAKTLLEMLGATGVEFMEGPLDGVESMREELESAQNSLDVVKKDRDLAIRDAWRQGCRAVEIADAAGLTRAQVYNIMKASE